MRIWMLGLSAAVAANTIAVPRIFTTPAAQVEVAYATAAPAAWLPDDPADSIYRAAREALNKGQYRQAAEAFAQLSRRYPRSGYAADALYWEAFARYRIGGDEQLKQALARLDDQSRRFPKAGTSGDAAALATRIRGELARGGDAASAQEVTRAADRVYTERTLSGTGRGSYSEDRSVCDDDSDVKLAALNAVMQMDADRAMPLLTRILARRDSGSTCLRRKAVFLVAQKHTDNSARVLIDAVHNDPDPEVRQQAVFWLSQVHTPEAIAALDSIVRRSDDKEMQEKAVFALSQQSDPAARAALRAIAERPGVDTDIREKVIFWLGQSGDEGGAYLRGLYPRLDDDRLKERVIFAVAQRASAEDRAWMQGVARDPKTSVELRKKAIFWLGQAGTSGPDLLAIYKSLSEPELKEQAIFALSQVKGGAAEQMIEIAKTDKDPEMRKKAVFWLGQSRDPRAAQYIEQLLSE